jgi:hypothetical protein
MTDSAMINKKEQKQQQQKQNKQTMIFHIYQREYYCYKI